MIQGLQPSNTTVVTNLQSTDVTTNLSADTDTTVSHGLSGSNTIIFYEIYNSDDELITNKIYSKKVGNVITINSGVALSDVKIEVYYV